jgi:hypothetical protein
VGDCASFDVLGGDLMEVKDLEVTKKYVLYSDGIFKVKISEGKLEAFKKKLNKQYKAGKKKGEDKYSLIVREKMQYDYICQKVKPVVAKPSGAEYDLFVKAIYELWFG